MYWCFLDSQRSLIARGKQCTGAFLTRNDRQSPEGSSVLVLSRLATIVNRQREAVYWRVLDSQRSLIARGKQCTGAFESRYGRQSPEGSSVLAAGNTDLGLESHDHEDGCFHVTLSLSFCFRPSPANLKMSHGDEGSALKATGQIVGE